MRTDKGEWGDGCEEMLVTAEVVVGTEESVGGGITMGNGGA